MKHTRIAGIVLAALVLTTGVAAAAPGSAPDDAGPPGELPGPVPDLVGELHDLIGQFVEGLLAGDLGPAVSDAAGAAGD